MLRILGMMIVGMATMVACVAVVAILALLWTVFGWLLPKLILLLAVCGLVGYIVIWFCTHKR